MHAGRVAVAYGREVVVEEEHGALLRCLMRGRRGPRPVCGDRVEYRRTEGNGIIERVLPRETVIERGDFRGRPRALAANVDLMGVVLAEPPGVDTLLLDRYLVLARHAGLAVALVVNKCDRLPPEARERIAAALSYRGELHGAPLHWVSARENSGLDALAAELAGRTAILVGGSGVGKSSLINALIPDLALRIGALSEVSGQGRHTTTATTLFRLAGGGALIDSPGVRTLRLDHLPPASVLAGFPEIARYMPECRFNDCRHDREPGCAVRAAAARGAIAADRLRHFHTLLAEAVGNG